MDRVPAVEQDAAFRVALDVRELRIKDDKFIRLCRDNPDLRLELTAGGELILMPPAGSETGWRKARIVQRLGQWTEQDGTGLCFDSSAGFTLPNGARLQTLPGFSANAGTGSPPASVPVLRRSARISSSNCGPLPTVWRTSTPR